MASSASPCETDLLVRGLRPGEDYLTPVRIVSTFISITIVASWTSKKIRRLSLFFAHWLSGLVMGVSFVVENMMVSVCWTGSNVTGFVKTLKYIEQAAMNMFALTNFAICTNLALIILSHRTLTRIKSISSPPQIFLLLAISLVTAGLVIPFWANVLVTGAAFWLTSDDERVTDWLVVNLFYVGFLIGICMFATMVWLLLFRMKDIKECWKLHVRIRYYFGLTIVGTAANLGLGICGLIYIVTNEDSRLLAWSWMFGWIHIALDTFVLYGVLQERNMDERGDGNEQPDPLSSGQQPASESGRGARRGSEVSNNSRKSLTSLVDGEAYATPIREIATLITVSVASSWCNARKIRRLSLFFSHWLSGLVLGLGYLAEDMMITVCWTSSNLEAFIKTLKYIELAASNMLAITNLAICVNLALIVSSHRTVTRVTSVSSLPKLLVFLAISMAIAAAAIPYWDTIVILGTGFFIINPEPKEDDFLMVSLFLVEFIVGICMLFIVIWLVLFRMKEIKECWMLHRRIRYYFGLTVLGTAVNLALGICGTLFVAGGQEHPILIIASWVFRYVHIALDTIVLYGVLRERNMDERGDGERSSGQQSGGPHGKPAPDDPLI
eukprot:g11874.t1